MDSGNAGSVNTQFDLDGRLLEANPSTSKRRSFAYYASGRLTTVTAPNTPWFNRVFDYDAAGRLTDAEGPPFGIIHYTYDRTGNLGSEIRLDETRSYTYLAGSNRLSSIGVKNIGFDPNGNLTCVGVGLLGSRGLIYNQDNRLIRVEQGGWPIAQYTYNAFGQRVTKNAGGTTTLYLYDFDGNLLAESSGTGTITTEYLHRGRNRLAMVNTGTGAVFYFHTDQFGTPQLMTDETNNQVWQANTKPFGEADVNPSPRRPTTSASRASTSMRKPDTTTTTTGITIPKTGRYLTRIPLGWLGGSILMLMSRTTR